MIAQMIPIDFLCVLCGEVFRISDLHIRSPVLAVVAGGFGRGLFGEPPVLGVADRVQRGVETVIRRIARCPGLPPGASGSARPPPSARGLVLLRTASALGPWISIGPLLVSAALAGARRPVSRRLRGLIRVALALRGHRRLR